MGLPSFIGSVNEICLGQREETEKEMMMFVITVCSDVMSTHVLKYIATFVEKEKRGLYTNS